MEIRKNIELRSSKIPVNFRFVPFVTPSNDANNISILNNAENDNNFLNGEEASHFYKEVISSPSTSKPSSSKKNQKKLTVTKSNNPPFSNSRLTVFHFAQEGNLEGIQHFLSNGCHIDVQDMYGWTPLMCSTFEGHFNIVEYLIKQGAKLDIKNKQGMTALDIAFKKNHKLLINLLKNGISKDLVSKNVKIKTESKYCDLCQLTYKESTKEHDRSIVHLLSSKKTDNSSTYYGIPENNKGFQIMLKKGWNRNSGLGINADGRKFPVKTVLKTDRACIGGKKEISKVTHFGPNDYRSVKVNDNLTLNLKKERRIKKRQMKKLENKHRQLQIEFRRQFHSE